MILFAKRRFDIMIIETGNLKTEYRDNMRGGDGRVKITHLVSENELCGKGRLFAQITLEPGCGIGYHTHDADSEIFHILEGCAIYSDNGSEKRVNAGDVLVCPKGEGHSIKNAGDDRVVLTALIVYA